MDFVHAPTPQSSLPDRITAWIRSQGGDHALLLITVDGYMRPHVMMLARDEIFAVSHNHLRVALGERSQSADNLQLRASATLALYDADLACFIKTRAMTGPQPLLPGTVYCDLTVEDVRLDTPTKAEATARLVTGLRFEGRAERTDIREKLAALGS